MACHAPKHINGMPLKNYCANHPTAHYSYASIFANMSDRFQTVLVDILQTEPQVVLTILYPSNTSISLITRVTKTYTKLLSMESSRRIRQLVYAYYLEELLQEEPKAPEELKACRRRITAYYYKATIRTYNI
ncbi:25334_t:CDS:1 [Gigaspora rosea]|nr:25334_t:CDS:1 [Gigaspora rosea]